LDCVRTFVYGDDYPTPGTAVRDYIHVVDLAKALLCFSLQRLLNKKKIGKVEPLIWEPEPSSVLEVIHTFEKVSGKKLPHKIVGRREGDITQRMPILTKERRFRMERPTEQAMASAWKWEQKNRS
jgi:UDP-glucose 4-epimerase